MANIIIVLLALSFTSAFAQKFIGYDCGARSLNVTTLSLLNVGECDIPNDTVEIKEVFFQLLQLNDYTETLVTQCKIEIFRSIQYCGMFSHISAASKGIGEYIQEVGPAECREMHRTGVFHLGTTSDHVIRGLKVNSTITHSVNFAGSIGNNGKCDGVGYSDPFGTWEDVIVTGTVKITLWQHIARVSLDKNTIHLRSGTVCPLNQRSCLDIEGGETFWDPIPLDQCGFNRYGQLYEGIANKMTDHVFNETQVVYSMSTQDVTFALTAKGRQNVCGYQVIRTEHPKLVVLETTKGNGFTQSAQISVDNLDIFTYMNSKFVYVEKHIRTQMKNLYRDVLLQRCNLERQSLKTSLSLATQSPDEFAYDLMKGPGFMAVVSGETVHVIRCVPVSVVLEHGDYCYSELQVSRDNTTYFMSPRTHILKRKGNQIACNALIPAYYLVGDTWLKILPQPTEAMPPTEMKPMTRPTWKYRNPDSLATSGIYREQDIRNLRERIMFPVERSAILNDVAGEMRGQPIADHDGSILRLLNDDAVDKIAWTAWDRLWAEFMKFGSFSAGVIAIVFIFYLFKSIVDVILRGFTLYSIFGLSIHLLGALWSSVAHCLIYSARPPRFAEPHEQQQHQRPENLIPLQTVQGVYPEITSQNQHQSEPTKGLPTFAQPPTNPVPNYTLGPRLVKQNKHYLFF